jgi:hypothetical protein
MAHFDSAFPRCTRLGLKPIAEVGNVFDPEDVLAKIGPTAHIALEQTLQRVVSSPHRHYPADHPVVAWRGCEVHCFYAEDVETFLSSHPAFAGRTA